MTARIGMLLALVAFGASTLPSIDAQAAPKKKKPGKNDQPPPATPPTPTAEPEIEIDPGAIEPATPAGTAPPPVVVNPTAAPEATENAAANTADVALGPTEVSWQDIVVVVRKPFLKASRIEFMPMLGVTLNDNMIRHYEFDGQINYWLTDVLAVGVEGQFFEHSFLEPYDLIGREYRRLPTLNEYKWGAALNFHYVPIYAKFTVVNKFIVHWETMFTAGVGVTQTEVLPRDPEFQGWTNLNITPNVGLTARFFITPWLTFDLGVKDYIFVDKFESVDRTTADVTDAMAHASTQLINNIMIGAGLSFWLPPSFSYTTFR